MAKRVRADELLVQQGLASSRTLAKTLILAGEVRSGDRLIGKPAELLDETLVLELVTKPPFVSRGAHKLVHALDTFNIDVAGVVAADIGASTGGFTDVLLQRGAQRIYAIDVGYGQLDYRLRQNERVVSMERVNARYLDSLPELVDFACVDVSFISLQLMFPTLARLTQSEADVVTLIKPQFEAGKELVGRGGVVRDLNVRKQTIVDVIGYAAALGFSLHGLTTSPLRGPAGNVEFLAWFRRDASGLDVSVAVDGVDLAGAQSSE